jgi:hypothetical protein
MFFFEKKNQKTFDRSLGRLILQPQKTDKVFLLLFLQKKKTLPF